MDFVCISVFVCARVYLDFFLFSDYFWHNRRLAEATGGYSQMNYIFGSMDGFTSNSLLAPLCFIRLEIRRPFILKRRSISNCNDVILACFMYSQGT